MKKHMDSHSNHPKHKNVCFTHESPHGNKILQATAVPLTTHLTGKNCYLYKILVVTLYIYIYCSRINVSVSEAPFKTSILLHVSMYQGILC